MCGIKRSSENLHKMIARVCSRNSICQVYNTGQTQQFQKICDQNFPTNKIYSFLEIGNRQRMIQRLEIIVELFCSPVRKNFTCIFCMTFHVKGFASSFLEQSSSSPSKSSEFKHGFVICPQYLCLADIFFECNQKKRRQGMTWDVSKSTSSICIFHVGLCSFFFPACF